ncbi:MAG: LemA family protein [Saprospiraceae bacterium]|jgi:LemA protein|nr:LemA family protein [Saprospiraceae bacterium]
MMDFRKYLPLIMIGLVVVLVFSMCGSYNGAVSKEENVKKAWSQVENQYQRRADLIPNLVNTVKGYANFEQQTLTAVVQARASATQVKVDPNELTPENIQRFEQAQQGLSGALGKLLMITENYPDLKANQSFLGLQQQLEGTENRISVERKNFNEAVNDYNSSIRRFPTNLLVGMFGFTPKGYFQATAGSDRAPEVKF